MIRFVAYFTDLINHRLAWFFTNGMKTPSYSDFDRMSSLEKSAEHE